MESAADRLKHARKLAKYEKAADAAAAIGVPYPTYAGHENGSRGFDAPRYATFFNVDLEWLITGHGEPRPSGKPRPGSLEARILALTPEGQAAIEGMIRALEEREAKRRTG